MTEVRIRDHAYQRAAERFGWKGAKATALITALYAESRIVGAGAGRTHILLHDRSGIKVVVEYWPEYVRIVTILLPEHLANTTGHIDPHVEPDDQAVWNDWVSRNGGKPR